MKTKKETLAIIQTIAEMFPMAKAELDHQNPFELLIATILSAQATDISVNKVTKELFKAYPTPFLMAAATVDEVIPYIQSIGLYRNKAKNIVATSRILVEKYEGQVPTERDQLMELPGVGRKTANVVMSVAFNVPAIAVDTHVERVSKRLELVKQDASVLEVEETLMKKLPKEIWSKTHHELIFFGRYHCTARAPKCDQCPLLDQCRFGQERLGIKKVKK